MEEYEQDTDEALKELAKSAQTDLDALTLKSQGEETAVSETTQRYVKLDRNKCRYYGNLIPDPSAIHRYVKVDRDGSMVN